MGKAKNSLTNCPKFTQIMNRMAGREHHLMQRFHNSFHFQKNHTLRFVFHFMCLQTASGQKTAVQLLKATQAACIKLSLNWNKSLKQQIATKKSHSRALFFFFKPLNAKIKLQVDFRWGKLIRWQHSKDISSPGAVGNNFEVGPPTPLSRPSSCSHS